MSINTLLSRVLVSASDAEVPALLDEALTLARELHRTADRRVAVGAVRAAGEARGFVWPRIPDPRLRWAHGAAAYREAGWVRA